MNPAPAPNNEEPSLCPIDTVPDELLGEIFLRCLPSDHWRTTVLLSSPPIVLTLVSSRWRLVALDTPSLWSTARIELQRAMFSEDDSLEPAFVSLLKRARNGPLNLSVTADWSVPHPSRSVQIQQRGQPQRPLEKLLHAVGRSLTRLVLEGSLNQELLHLPSGLFPSLQSFVCNISFALEGTLTIDEEALQSCLGDAPALRRVALDIGPPGLCMKQFAFPWEQLTHFREVDRRRKRPHFLAQLLPKCRELRWLGVELNDDEMLYGDESFDELPETLYDEMHATITTLPNLRTLSIGPIFDDNLCYPFVFSTYEFPNLRSLCITSGQANGYASHGDRFLMKLATFTHLEYLSFHATSFSAEVLAWILQALPRLSTLHLSADDQQRSYKSIFPLLGEEDPIGTCTVLPQLHTLILNHHLSVIPPDVREQAHFGSMRGSGGPVWWESLNVKTLELFLAVRTRCRPEAQLRKLVVYGLSAEDVVDERMYVQCIQRYTVLDGLEFERRICKHGSRDSAIWMEPDPEVRGWEEATTLLSSSY